VFRIALNISCPIKIKAIRTTEWRTQWRDVYCGDWYSGYPYDGVANFVQQANHFGGQGSARLSDIALGTMPPIVTASFYFKPANCTGFLCTTLNPLTQN